MSIGRRLRQAWAALTAPQGISPGGFMPVEAVPPMLLDAMARPDNPGNCSVLRITNGFMVMKLTYNPSGPNKVEATYCNTIEDLGQELARVFATDALTRK